MVRFFENEAYLKHTFSFEKLGNNLHYLGQCPDTFKIQPSLKTQKLANLLFNKLTSQNCLNENIKKTLLYIQIRQVIDTYLKEIE